MIELINQLLSKFKEVRHIPIHLNYSYYLRDIDRVILPPISDSKEYLFVVAHELGHKYNSKILIFFYMIFQNKFFQYWLEVDANNKAKDFLPIELHKEYDEFMRAKTHGYLE